MVRLERFSAETATVTAVAEVRNPPWNEPAGPSLVEGMFCEVRIPGRTARGVFRIPASAVDHERRVPLCVKGRLVSRPIEIVHREGDEVLARGGLAEGDILVTTRLAVPIEGTRLDVRLSGGAAGGDTGNGDAGNEGPAGQAAGPGENRP